MSDDELVRKFRFGMKKSCGIAIWQSIQDEVAARMGSTGRDVSHEQVANYFRLKRSDVSKGLAQGNLSLEALVTMLTQLDWQFGNLDRRGMPDKRARALAGYQEAVRLARTGEAGAANETISCEAFLSLCALFGDKQFLRLDAEERLDDKAWESILTRALPKMVSLLGLTDGRQLPYRTLSDLKDLRQRWGRAVARCLAAIPYRHWVGP